MSRAGGNLVRTRERRTVSKVSPQTVLSLLKTVPGVFGEVANKDVEEIAPAIIYKSGENKYIGFIDATKVPVTERSAHVILAADRDRRPDEVIKAYYVGSRVGRLLFPNANDLLEKAEPVNGSREEKLSRVGLDFAERGIVVTEGGIEGPSGAVNLFWVVDQARQQLAMPHGRVDPIIQAEVALRQTLERATGAELRRA